MSATNEKIESDFEEAYRIAAHVVTKFSDKYLPIFERMHEEKQKRQSNLKLRNLALQIANTEP